MRKPHLRSLGPHIPPLDRVTQFADEPGYVVFTMPVDKRVRVEVGGTVVADSRSVLMLWETGHLPVYYFPLRDIRMDLMTRTGHRSEVPYKGTAEYHSVAVGGRTVENILWRYADPIAACPPIGDYAAFYWSRADRWLEEDEEVFVHPRDPYKRIDCVSSSAHIEIDLDGIRLAESRRVVMLFETGLPTRYYLPMEDVRRACWSRAITGPAAHTRDRRDITTSSPARSAATTSSGTTPSRCPRPSGSRAASASTTSSSISLATARHSKGRRRRSRKGHYLSRHPCLVTPPASSSSRSSGQSAARRPSSSTKFAPSA